jgi:hypothetical protein
MYPRAQASGRPASGPKLTFSFWLPCFFLCSSELHLPYLDNGFPLSYVKQGEYVLGDCQVIGIEVESKLKLFPFECGNDKLDINGLLW